ncbi:hypothetical protein G647_02723 [Cladophialophora carrionii CBS 160.54]|uniref:Uncharacterized protein n=1 Tax=Cladophialophora carrionii CBS 160.54 TaxID=1279043 RepID=V9DH02_9EURO|nr:uncharacterized protein G647_02723 [Cladophialophora carrionii CBS 160.54]ETI25946.1 hypothetical protein G647_02723 [Cladophialophora carrionii CBS 160.54]
MGASQSVQNAPGIPREDVQREMELIHRRLETVSIPDQATEYADILPHYHHVLAIIDLESVQQSIAVFHLMISSHAKATRLSATYASLTAELVQCQQMLITLYAGIRSSKSALLQFGSPMSVDATKDSKIKELADTITFMVDELDGVQGHLFHILHVMLQASQTCTGGHVPQQDMAKSCPAELRDALQALEETSLALRNRISKVMSDYTKAVERTRELSKDKKHLNEVAEQLAARLKSADEENQALKAQNAKLIEECREKNMWIRGINAKIDGMCDTMKRAEAIVLGQKVTRLGDQKNDQEEVKQLRAENARLKDQSTKVEALRAENSGLKRKLKESNVKDLEKRLHEANTELDQLRTLFKDRDDDDDGRPQNDHAHTDAVSSSSDNEEPSNAVEGVSFAEGASRILQCHKAILAELRAQISKMKDVRGGSGWSIVHRTDAMVKRKTARMLKDIDDCLALRDAGEREKDRVERLETEGFPAWQSVISGSRQSTKDSGAAKATISKRRRARGKSSIPSKC